MYYNALDCRRFAWQRAFPTNIEQIGPDRTLQSPLPSAFNMTLVKSVQTPLKGPAGI